MRCKDFLIVKLRLIVIRVTIATKNFRFLYTVEEVLSKINNIKTNHILPNEFTTGNTDVIITTETEKKHFPNEKLFIPKAFNHYYLYSNICLLTKNQNKFSKLTIGIDPGKTIGFAVICEDKIILGVNEFFNVIEAVKESISVFFNVEADIFEINVGRGGGSAQKEIVRRLKDVFHDKVPVNIVNEDFTSQNRNKLVKDKFSKNINAALNIASRDT